MFQSSIGCYLHIPTVVGVIGFISIALLRRCCGVIKVKEAIVFISIVLRRLAHRPLQLGSRPAFRFGPLRPPATRPLDVDLVAVLPPFRFGPQHQSRPAFRFGPQHRPGPRRHPTSRAARAHCWTLSLIFRWQLGETETPSVPMELWYSSSLRTKIATDAGFSKVQKNAMFTMR